MDIIITGLSKVGKSSIKKVVFEKMTPHESVYLETSNIIESCSLENLGYTYLVVRDYPFNYRYENANQTELKYLSTCGVLIYVIDSQDISDITFEHFKKVVLSVLQKNPKVQVDVFLHKLDGAYFLQNNTHSQRFQEINSTINKIFSEVQIEKMANIYKTSIYDHSLFEAFSKIFQRLMPQNAMFSKLLDYLTNSCKFEKAYLFDVTNKIYIGIDGGGTKTDAICTDGELNIERAFDIEREANAFGVFTDDLKVITGDLIRWQHTGRHLRHLCRRRLRHRGASRTLRCTKPGVPEPGQRHALRAQHGRYTCGGCCRSAESHCPQRTHPGPRSVQLEHWGTGTGQLFAARAGWRCARPLCEGVSSAPS